ncbi:MAG: restriction endonuclease [Bacteroidota bacterium]|nr:restriction endonuclease [Bacteroidota bacterium]
MPQYDFKSLSSYDFEILVRDLLQKELHVTLETFKAGRDNGIDLRFSHNNNQTIIIQCKHYASSSFSVLISHLKLETIKLNKLKTKPNRYILATSLGLSPDNKNRILKLFTPFILKEQDIFGNQDLNNLLKKFPSVERQNFKLWLTSAEVLNTVLHSKIFNQTQITIEKIKRKLNYYVQNESYRDAQKILRKNHYCIIAGIPGIGKTTLADILIVRYLGKGYEAIKISKSISEALEIISETKKQVFYYDDFLGQTSLEHKLAKNEDEELLNFIDYVKRKKNKRFILTTREYILSQAKNVYEKISRSNFDIHKCVIDLEKYTKLQRAKILFNHIYHSLLPLHIKKQLLKDHSYKKIVGHPNFNPRIVEWMTGAEFYTPKPKENYVRAFLNNLDDPSRLWKHIYDNQLSIASKKLLVVLTTLPSEVLIKDLELAFDAFYSIKNTTSSFDEQTFTNSMHELDGNFIKTEKIGRNIIVSFHNPSVRDFLEKLLKDNDKLIKQIFNSIVFFNQIEKAWEILKNYSHKKDKEIKKEFLLNAQKSIRSMDCEILTWYEEKNLYRWKKIPMDKRIAFILNEMKYFTKDEQMLIIGDIIDNLNKLILSHQIEKTLIVSISQSIENIKSLNNSKKDDIILKLKTTLLERSNSTQDFVELMDFYTRHSQIITEEDEDDIRNRFEEFSNAYQEELTNRNDDIYTFEEDLSRIKKISRFFKSDSNDLITELNEKINSIKENEDEPEEENNDDLNDNSNREKEENQEIESLFSTLLYH